jgi:hypothetical protein
MVNLGKVPSQNNLSEVPSLINKTFWPEDLPGTVARILELPTRKPSRPEFVFELTMEAAVRNFMVFMKKYKGDLGIALEAQQDSPLGMGSEFCPPSVLKSIEWEAPNLEQDEQNTHKWIRLAPRTFG